jgi:ABC-type multidrug transport system fused ATPase/permease subunit
MQLPTRRKVWTGDASLSAPDAADDKAPYYVLRPSDVTTALVPEPLAPGPGESVVLEADAQNFSLTLTRIEAGRGVARRRVWLSRDTLRPSRLRVYDARGDVASDSVLSGFRDGAPRSITIRRPAEGYEAAFSLEKVELNGRAGEGLHGPRPEGSRGGPLTGGNGEILRTIDLRMVYHVGKVEVHALRGVDISVQKGEFVSIVGPSGCGKSTLLHLLGGLARPSSGRILVDGVEISAAADKERTRIRRERIGFVFQRFNLFPTLTVRGNLEIARQIGGFGVPRYERLV